MSELTGNKRCLSLYPQASDETALKGLYLREDLHQYAVPNTPYIYANYVTSMDGRVAEKSGTEFSTPAEIASPIDWQLFKELQCQAECLITHGGYMRSLENGSLGNVLEIHANPDDNYLQVWRHTHRNNQQPHVMIVSKSLDFNLPACLLADTRRVTVITGTAATNRKLCQLQEAGVNVIQKKHAQSISAVEIAEQLQALSLRSAYLQTGPELMHSMLLHKLLARIYITTDLSLLGGSEFLTLISGERLKSPVSLALQSLYLVNENTALQVPREQLFYCLDTVYG